MPSDELVEAMKVAILTAIVEHGVPTDIQEHLVRGDGRGTVLPGALDRMAKAALAVAEPAIRADEREKAAKVPNPIGDAGDALDFALDHMDDAWNRSDFLDCWRLGDLAEWPEYLRWLEVQRQGAAAIRAGQGERG